MEPCVFLRKKNSPSARLKIAKGMELLPRLLIHLVTPLVFFCTLTDYAVAADKRAGDPQTVPRGLTASDWKSIRAAHEEQRRAITPSEAGYRAYNPGQQWQTEFDGHGFLTRPKKGDWRWGLELRSYGFAGHERFVERAPRAKAEGQRMTYEREEGVHEWFVNDERGLEHGFTIQKRPADALGSEAPLVFTYAVRGTLHPVISSGEVRFVDDKGAAVVMYAKLQVWDAAGKSLPARFLASDAGLVLSVDERNAHYPITIDPIAQQAYLKASNAEAGDFFGASVAISGDTVVVGAYGEDSAASGVNGNQADNSASSSGAAYIFVRSGSTWTQQAYLKASNTGANDFFGVSVAISGNTIVVGAYGEDSAATGVNGNQADNGAIDSGAAYVFARSGSTWTQQAYLKASNTGSSDLFVNPAISGDTAVVGALYEDSAARGVNGNQADNSAKNSGAAYVFNGLPATGPIQNISTRAEVLSGGKVLIGGFVVSGTSTKQVLVRGLGPTLADVGLTGALADPTLELHHQDNQGHDSIVATNDNWKQTQQAAIQATGKAPAHESEAATLQTLAPGNYTAILAGKNNTTGVGLVEVYDVNAASSAQLSNISSRGYVGTSSNVMIGGFISAVADTRVLVRALGPTLTQFGVSGALADPVLGLFDANGNAIASNDNWQQGPQAAQIQSSGFAPPNALEPAIISMRPLGNTTAIVSGKNGTSGVALMEVYRLP